MATDGGPNIERDGLVFGMDTGYGVANNSTATRFYRGEPTTNYVPGTYGYGMYAYASGPVDDTAQNENGQVVPVKRYTIYQASNTARAAIRPDTNTTDYHTFSFKWKYNGTTTTSPSISVSAAKGNPEGGANNNGFEYQTGDTISIGKNWYLSTYTFKFSSNPTGKCILTFGINTGSNQSYLGETFDIYEAQFELKDRVTPFVNGTRSSTQSLIDLTKSANIDASNVSFGSNGQPVWDGTDDRSDVTSHSSIEIVDNVSIEYVYKRLSTDPVLDVIANKYHGTGWELFCGNTNKFALAGRNGDGTYYSTGNGGQTMVNNKFYHLVAQKEGTSWRLYVNGELDSSTTANSVGTWSNTGVLQIGGEGNGYFPHMELPVLKVYNRVLSTDEIKQNYNAYKNRFDI